MTNGGQLFTPCPLHGRTQEPRAQDVHGVHTAGGHPGEDVRLRAEQGLAAHQTTVKTTHLASHWLAEQQVLLSSQFMNEYFSVMGDRTEKIK
jgi:hypothetical protein